MAKLGLVPGSFSVIIPTLQRSGLLRPLVQQCAAHPRVNEVLVINNASVPIGFSDTRVKVLQQSRNIFVNPAWNLGASTASAPWLAIINDDVEFRDEALTYAADLLERGRYAVITPDNSCLYAPLDPSEGRPIGHRIASSDNIIFGTFMCMKKEDYVVVPDQLLIWGGDHLQFWDQRRPNAVLINTPFRTAMSTTAGSGEFEQLREREAMAAARLVAALRGRHWWHRPARALRAFRFARARVKQLVGR